MNSRHSKTPKILLHGPIYHLNLVIFGFLRYDLCLPITDFSVISAISLLFLCYICYGFSVMDRSRLYAYKNNSQVVKAVTSYRITINKVRKSQKIVASLYDKTLYFLLILTTFSMKKVTGNVRKELRLTRY